jgi:hypothetical protein
MPPVQPPQEVVQRDPLVEGLHHGPAETVREPLVPLEESAVVIDHVIIMAQPRIMRGASSRKFDRPDLARDYERDPEVFEAITR